MRRHAHASAVLRDDYRSELILGRDGLVRRADRRAILFELWPLLFGSRTGGTRLLELAARLDRLERSERVVLRRHLQALHQRAVADVVVQPGLIAHVDADRAGLR